MHRNVNLKEIRIDGGTQGRVELNQDVVAEYAEIVRDGADLPPVTLFNDGTDLWMADGFHRFFGYMAADRASIPADVRVGSQRDAVLYSVGANTSHGLRRTNADKRKAVLTILGDPEWSQWSDRKIAEACGVGHPFVAAVRNPERAAAQTEARKPKVESDSTPARGTKVESDSTHKQPEPTPKAPTEAEQIANDAHGDDDPAELLATLQRELEEAHALIKAAEADDLKAEVIRWHKAYDHAQREQSRYMDLLDKSKKREELTMRLLRRCGKAVDEADPDKIAAVVEAMARKAREVA